MAGSLIPFLLPTLCKFHSASGVTIGCDEGSWCGFVFFFFFHILLSWEIFFMLFLIIPYASFYLFSLYGIFLTYHSMTINFYFGYHILISKLIFTFCFLIPTPIYSILFLFYGYSIFS